MFQYGVGIMDPIISLQCYGRCSSRITVCNRSCTCKPTSTSVCMYTRVHKPSSTTTDARRTDQQHPFLFFINSSIEQLIELTSSTYSVFFIIPFHLISLCVFLIAILITLVESARQISRQSTVKSHLGLR